MGIFKKKGSIVPRFLICARNSIEQRSLRFGCDVEIRGQKVIALNTGTIIENSIYKFRYKNARKFRSKNSFSSKCQLIGLGANSCAYKAIFY